MAAVMEQTQSEEKKALEDNILQKLNSLKEDGKKSISIDMDSMTALTAPYEKGCFYFRVQPSLGAKAELYCLSSIMIREQRFSTVQLESLALALTKVIEKEGELRGVVESELQFFNNAYVSDKMSQDKDRNDFIKLLKDCDDAYKTIKFLENCKELKNLLGRYHILEKDVKADNKKIAQPTSQTSLTSSAATTSSISKSSALAAKSDNSKVPLALTYSPAGAAAATGTLVATASTAVVSASAAAANSGAVPPPAASNAKPGSGVHSPAGK